MPHPNVLSGREELLTEHALTWNKRKIKKMAVYLAKRFTKVGLNKKIYAVINEQCYSVLGVEC